MRTWACSRVRQHARWPSAALGVGHACLRMRTVPLPCWCSRVGTGGRRGLAHLRSAFQAGVHLLPLRVSEGALRVGLRRRFSALRPAADSARRAPQMADLAVSDAGSRPGCVKPSGVCLKVRLNWLACANVQVLMGGVHQCRRGETAQTHAHTRSAFLPCYSRTRVVFAPSHAR